MRKPHECAVRDFEFVEMAVKNRMKAEAYSSAQPLNDIYHNVLNEFSEHIGAGISYHSMLGSLKDARSRRYERANCTVEELVAHIESNDCLEEIKIVCQAVVHFAEDNGTRHYAIILGCPEVLARVGTEHQYFLCDATFKTAPRPFSQLFNIMVSHEGVAIPILHVAMSSKHSGLYEGTLMKIREICPQLEPRIIKSDYEMGLMRAIRAAFKNATIAGCYFHYCQAVFRAMMRTGNVI